MKTTHFAHFGIPAAMTVLPNGFTVASCQTRSVFVSTSLVFGTGSVDDGKHPGISHLLEHAMFAGPVRTSVHPALKELTDRAVEPNACTSRWDTSYHLGNGRDIAPMLGGLFGMTGDLIITPEVLDAERGVVIQEQRDDAESIRRSVWCNKLLYPHVPDLHYTPDGTEESVRRITLADLRRHYERMYTPSNALLVVTSRHPHEAVLELVQHYTLATMPSMLRRTARPYVAPVCVRADYDNPHDSEDIQFTIPLPTEAVSESDLFLLGVVGDLLCENPYGLLWQRLRLERNIVYRLGAGTSDAPFRYFQYGMGVEARHADTVEAEVLLALQRVQKGDYPSEALQVIYHRRHNSMTRFREGMGVAGCEDELIESWLFGEDCTYDPTTLPELITRESLARVAEQYLVGKPYSVIRTVNP